MRAHKLDLLRIGRALGLRVSERETSLALAERALAAAHQLRRDHDTMASAVQRAVRAEYDRREARRKR